METESLSQHLYIHTCACITFSGVFVAPLEAQRVRQIYQRHLENDKKTGNQCVYLAVVPASGQPRPNTNPVMKFVIEERLEELLGIPEAEKSVWFCLVARICWVSIGLRSGPYSRGLFQVWREHGSGFALRPDFERERGGVFKRRGVTIFSNLCLWGWLNRYCTISKEHVTEHFQISKIGTCLCKVAIWHKPPGSVTWFLTKVAIAISCSTVAPAVAGEYLCTVHGSGSLEGLARYDAQVLRPLQCGFLMVFEEKKWDRAG